MIKLKQIMVIKTKIKGDVFLVIRGMAFSFLHGICIRVYELVDEYGSSQPINFPLDIFYTEKWVFEETAGRCGNLIFNPL